LQSNRRDKARDGLLLPFLWVARTGRKKTFIKKKSKKHLLYFFILENENKKNQKTNF
jgi:hypothetical protein